MTVHLVHQLSQRARLLVAEREQLDRRVTRARSELIVEQIAAAVGPRVARYRRRRTVAAVFAWLFSWRTR